MCVVFFCLICVFSIIYSAIVCYGRKYHWNCFCSIYTVHFFFSVTFVSYQSQTETFVGIELDQKCLSNCFSKWTRVSLLNRVRGSKQESIYILITTSCLSTIHMKLCIISRPTTKPTLPKDNIDEVIV